MKTVTVTGTVVFVVAVFVLALALSGAVVGLGMPACPTSTPTPTPPTNVFLVRFEAHQEGRAVMLIWETASEVDNLGFNLYRATSPTGPRAKLNKVLIPSQGMGSPIGYVYTWTDDRPARFYWLEDVDVWGNATLHGPIQVKAETGSR